MFLINCAHYDDFKKKFGAASPARPTKYDLVSNYFKSLGYSGTMSDMESQFLAANSVPASAGTLADRWAIFLKAAPQSLKGRLSDMIRAWLRS